jgi:hypothetical protein
VGRKMENERLAIFDFDGTISNTFEVGPSGVGVNEAYDLAVTKVFGREGRVRYEENGKLMNRAPTEVVFDLINSENNKVLLENAKEFFDENLLRLLSIMPENFDKKSFLTENPFKLNDLLTWMLVSEKCSYMLDQIGQKLSDGEIWPRPEKGFVEFYNFIKEEGTINGVSIRTAIVSSGHREFIRKTFDAYGLSMPDYMVTDDEIRKVSLPVLRKTKPAPYPIAVVHNQWLKDRKLGSYDKSGIIYFGDDFKKDGLLAKNCRVAFGHYDKKLRDNLVILDEGVLCFSNWRIIKDLMVRNRNDLVEGNSWVKIMNSYAE